MGSGTIALAAVIAAAWLGHAAYSIGGRRPRPTFWLLLAILCIGLVVATAGLGLNSGRVAPPGSADWMSKADIDRDHRFWGFFGAFLDLAVLTVAVVVLEPLVRLLARRRA